MTKPKTSPGVEATPLQTLLAAARKMNKQKIGGLRHRKTEDSWQADSWDMYDLVGEFRFITNALASRIGKAHIYLAKMGEDGNVVEKIDAGPLAEKYLRLFGKTRNGREQLLRRMGLNLLVPGECWVVGVSEESIPEEADSPYTAFAPDLAPQAEDADVSWAVLSVSEVRPADTEDRMVLDLPEGSVSVDPDSVDLVRVWQPHPRKFNEPDSGTRSSLPILRELVGLTMHISAQVDSRLAGAGILVIPQSAQRALREAAGIADDTTRDEFTEALMDAMLTPINDRSSASAVVPLTITVPDDVTDKFNHIKFSTPLDAEARALREEALRRLALSMDAPPELLLGTASMNHWGAWLVSEEVVRSHVEPPLALICDALTTQYLWPAMEDDGEENVEQYAFWFDVEHLIVHPNTTGDAKELHARNVLTDEALRRYTGFSEEDSPEKIAVRERTQAFMLQLAKGDPTILQNGDTLRDMVQNMQALLGEGDFAEAPEPPPVIVMPSEDEDAETDEEADKAGDDEGEDREGESKDSTRPEEVGDPKVADG